MNNFEDNFIDELDEAEQSYNIDLKVIKQFKRESKQKKIDGKKKKKINKIKLENEEKE